MQYFRVPGIVDYVAARVGLRSSPFMAQLPPVESMRHDKSPRTIRLGGTGTSVVSGTIADLDPNTDLAGDKWYGSLGGLGVVGKMLRDPHVRQSISYITDPLRNATWRFRPASKDPLHVEQADFCTWAFVERLPWDQIIKRIVQGYASDGFCLHEITDDVVAVPVARFPMHAGRGAGVLPTAFHHITANTVDGWIQRKDAPGQLESVRQYVPYSDVEGCGYRTIPSDRILRYTYDQDGANFAGMSVLRSAYGAWKCKLAFLAIDAIKHERRGVGTPIIILGEQVNDEDVSAAETTLAQMRANAKGYAIFPHGYEFRWDTGSTSDGTDLQAAIERCNKDIAVNVSAGFMLLGLTGGSGSYALGATQQSQYHLSVAGHARFVAAGFTNSPDGWSPVRRLLDLNYGAVDALPTLEARNLPTRNWLDVLPQMINATNVGLLTADDKLEDELREIFQVGARDDSTARKRAPLAGATQPAAEPMHDEPECDGEEDAETDATEPDDADEGTDE